MKQLHLLKKENKAYGGELRKTRKGRSAGRPLDSRNTMHLVLRSSQAKGEKSFLRSKNRAAVQRIVNKFSNKYGIKILSLANVGNHLHFHIKLSTRHGYKPFIRAVTAAIAMAVTGVNRWNKTNGKTKFWDYRPFTRVVVGFKAFLGLRHYVEINQLEGLGWSRINAELLLSSRRSSA